jgi:hypothetical protein
MKTRTDLYGMCIIQGNNYEMCPWRSVFGYAICEGVNPFEILVVFGLEGRIVI